MSVPELRHESRLAALESTPPGANILHRHRLVQCIPSSAHSGGVEEGAVGLTCLTQRVHPPCRLLNLLLYCPTLSPSELTRLLGRKLTDKHQRLDARSRDDLQKDLQAVRVGLEVCRRHVSPGLSVEFLRATSHRQKQGLEQASTTRIICGGPRTNRKCKCT
jgi:hypothetical protein